METKNMMVSVKNTKLIEEVFNDHHIVEDGDKFEKGYSLKCECKTELNSSEKFDVENYLTVGEKSTRLTSNASSLRVSQLMRVLWNQPLLKQQKRPPRRL